MARLSATDRRRSLLEGAAAVMTERGFARATTRDVAARVGVTRGLLHHYFATWEELQRAAFRWSAERAQEEVDRALAEASPAAALRTLLDLMLARPADAQSRLYADAWDEAQRDPELARLYAEIARWWRERIERLIGAGVEEGGMRCADPAASAWRLAGLADGLSGYVLLAEDALPRDDALALLLAAAERET